MRCMVSDVILLGCSTSVLSEVIFESIMRAENVNNILQLYRNTMILVIRIKIYGKYTSEVMKIVGERRINNDDSKEYSGQGMSFFPR